MHTLVHPARRLVEHRTGHPVVSLYLDLDPERFATAPARASQIRSLLDEAAKGLEARTDLNHDDRIGLRADLGRVRDFLHSREAPFRGARALAVFCCGREGMFETVQLRRPTAGRVVFGASPYVEPMVAAMQQRDWCVVLVSRRDARVFIGPADALRERAHREDEIHGQHEQGGWSQAHYERSIEKDTEDHLRAVAEIVESARRRDGFDRIALGGPTEVVPRLEAHLSEEARARLAPGRVEVDVSSSSETEIRAAVASLVEADERQGEREALDRMAAGVGSGRRGAGGPEDTVAALNERRVETLLLEPGFDGTAERCGVCGLLLVTGSGEGRGAEGIRGADSLEGMPPASPGACPADGGALEHLDHLREAAVEAALAQDATVMVVRHHPDLGPFQGIGAVLRF